MKNIDFLVFLESMSRISLHPSLPVEVEPQVFITHWSVIEAEFSDGTKTRHIVGRHINIGRVSTAIQRFDKEMKRFTTQSGRVYQLKGKNGIEKDSEYVWNRWSKLINVTKFIDVTNEYIDTI